MACILYSIFIIHRLCNVCVDKFLERLIYCCSLHYLNKILGYFPRKTVRNTLAVAYWDQLLVGWVYVGWLRFVHVPLGKSRFRLVWLILSRFKKLGMVPKKLYQNTLKRLKTMGSVC